MARSRQPVLAGRLASISLFDGLMEVVVVAAAAAPAASAATVAVASLPAHKFYAK